MKKRIYIVTALLVSALCVGCGNKKNRIGNRKQNFPNRKSD